MKNVTLWIATRCKGLMINTEHPLFPAVLNGLQNKDRETVVGILVDEKGREIPLLLRIKPSSFGNVKAALWFREIELSANITFNPNKSLPITARRLIRSGGQFLKLFKEKPSG